MTVFDRYGRDYRMEGSTGMRVAGSGLLSGAGFVQPDPPAAVSTIDRRLGLVSEYTGPWQGYRISTPLAFSFSPAQGQTLSIAGNVAVDVGPGGTGSALRAVVSSPVGTSTLWEGGGWSFGLSSGRSRGTGASIRTASISIPGGLGFEFTRIGERGSALGLRLDAASVGLAANTSMATLTARRVIMGTALSAQASVTATRVDGGSELLRFEGPLTGTAFSLEGARLMFGGVATLGLSSPLRVERARASILTPVSYDLISGDLVTARTSIDLTPNAREMDFGLRWSTAIASRSSMRFGVVRAFDAGHVQGASDVAAFASLFIR